MTAISRAPALRVGRWEIVSLLAIATTLVACGQHPVRRAWEQRLLAADRAFDDGDLEAATAEYDSLATTSRRPSDLRYLAFQQAWALEKQGARARALGAYEAIWRDGQRDEFAARAVYRAGRVLLDQYGDREAAGRVWERLVISRPDRAVARRPCA